MRLRLHLFVSAFVLIPTLISLPTWAVDPHRSFAQLPTGNGFGFAVYDASTARISTFTDHPYAQRTSTETTHSLAYDTYFGLRASGAGAWLGELPVDQIEYRDQTNVIHATQSFGPLRAETYAFSPWDLSAPAVVLVLHVTNNSQLTLTDAASYVLLNFHLGSGTPPGTDGEHISYDVGSGSYSESGPSGVTLSYVPLAMPTHHGASPNNPYPIVLSAGSLIDTSDSGTVGDAVAGYQWSFASLAPGADAWVGVVISTASASTVASYVASRDPSTLVNDEVAHWNAWRVAPPDQLSPAELRVWRQSETVLRMAQSREPAPSGGQLVAALPPGQWWISWVRDMSYGIAALARSGHAAEANAGIDFFHGAHVGDYRTYVGQDYHVSVVRYYGDGSEWSDSDANGPNIEFDGFGLSTWAARLAGRNDLDSNSTTLSAMIDSTGLVAADSSIWEVHWNGHQKHFSYTSIAAAQSICLTGNATTAQSIRDALVQHVILPGGGIAGNLEELQHHDGALDAAAIEAINFGLINPQGALATQTLAAFEGLRTPVGRGFFRNDDGGGYDSQEWVFIDLRIADAWMRMGQADKANDLIAWVTAQADSNFDLHAELYHRDNADYVGAIPMVGFGAGAYMLTLLDRAHFTDSHPECFPAEQNVGMGAVPDSGTAAGGLPPMSTHACSATPVQRGRLSLGWSLLAIGLLVLIRKRRFLAVFLAGTAACGPAGSTGDAGHDASDHTSIPRDGPASVDGLPVRDCTSRFAYSLGHGAQQVAVAGDWNQFSMTTNPLTDGLGTNVFRGSVTLGPGSYGYKFVADGNWSFDPSNGLTTYVAGQENSRLVVSDCNAPMLRVIQANAASDRTVSIDLQYIDGVMRAGLNPSSLTVLMNRMPLAASAMSVDVANAKISIQVQVPENNKYTFRINVSDSGARAATELIVPMWVEPEPFQWTDGPLYFVFTDRFRNGDTSNDTPIPGVDMRANYQGGDLHGVLLALQEGYFDRLGIRSIWLSPINTNTNSPGLGTGNHQYSAYHGYWVSEPRSVEEHWGSLDDLRAVTAEAHRRGIRVIFDLANNQLHQDHPYFQMHRDWFNGDGSCVCGGTDCDWTVHMLDCWFASYLPDVNWTNMAAVDQMIDDAMYWLVEADADGFRVDAVKHMPHIASTTLRLRIQQTLETGNARYYLVGETFSGGGDQALVESFINGHELSGQFDFPLFWSIGSAFASNQGTMMDLENAVHTGEATYIGATMSPFLGNHDVERFLSRAAGQITGGDQSWTNPPSAPDSDDPYNRLFLATAFLLTQPGVPLMYYGDEIGMVGAADPDNRRMMRFGADLAPREQSLLQRVTTIAHARGTHPGLRRGLRRSLYADGDGDVYARGADTDLAVIALNRGSTSRTVHVTMPPELASDGVTLHDLLGGPSITVSAGAIDVNFNPQSAALYVR